MSADGVQSRAVAPVDDSSKAWAPERPAGAVGAGGAAQGGVGMGPLNVILTA